MADVFIALGSNINDRLAFLSKAETILSHNPDITILKASKVYETEPWPREYQTNKHPDQESGQEWFLNQVIKIETDLSPQELAKVAEDIENEIGRTLSHHWGPREIDIDILLYDGQVIDSPDLEIPHRHMRDRQFVLVPLVEIAPDLKDPTTGSTFKEILERAKKVDDHKVTPFL